MLCCNLWEGGPQFYSFVGRDGDCSRCLGSKKREDVVFYLLNNMTHVVTLVEDITKSNKEYMFVVEKRGASL